MPDCRKVTPPDVVLMQQQTRQMYIEEEQKRKRFADGYERALRDAHDANTRGVPDDWGYPNPFDTGTDEHAGYQTCVREYQLADAGWGDQPEDNDSPYYGEER